MYWNGMWYLEYWNGMWYLEYWATDTVLGKQICIYSTWNTELRILYLEYWAAGTILEIQSYRYCTWNTEQQILHLEYWAADTVLGILSCRYCTWILRCRYCTWNTELQILYLEFSVVDTVLGIPIGPLPAKCWPEVFMQHSFTTYEKGGRQNRMEEKLRYHYQCHHNYLPPPLAPNSYRWRGGGRKVGRKNLRKLSHTLTHAHSDLE